MAIVDLATPRWTYDTVAKTLNLTFVEPCPRNEPDPVAWVPEFDYKLSLNIAGNVTKIPHVDPNTPVI